MDLGYFAADTMGVTLYQIKGRLVANEVHQIQMGPWKLDMRVDVESDVLGATELGFWLTLGKTLRLYVVIREKENWLFVLNTDKLRACGEQTGFEGHTIKERILEFKPAIKGVFRWKNDGWEQMRYDEA